MKCLKCKGCMLFERHYTLDSRRLYARCLNCGFWLDLADLLHETLVPLLHVRRDRWANLFYCVLELLHRNLSSVNITPERVHRRFSAQVLQISS